MWDGAKVLGLCFSSECSSWALRSAQGREGRRGSLLLAVGLG